MKGNLHNVIQVAVLAQSDANRRGIFWSLFYSRESAGPITEVQLRKPT